MLQVQEQVEIVIDTGDIYSKLSQMSEKIAESDILDPLCQHMENPINQ